MSIEYTTHIAREVVDQRSNFQIYPFSSDTGCPISDVKKPHMHDFYVVHYVSSGSGTCVIDFETYDIVSGSMYFVSPGQLHLWNPDGILQGHVMVFSDDFLSSPDSPVGNVFELEFFNSVANSPMFMLSTAQSNEVALLMGSISREYSSARPGYISVLRSYFHILLVNLKRMFEDRIKQVGVRTENRIVREFKRQVALKSGAQLRVQDYAQDMGISVSRLNAVVKEVTSMTPGRIIRNELVTSAKRMLAHSDLNVAEICYELEFEDPSYFGRFFKRETGYTPSVFREQVRGKYLHLAG